MLYISPQVLFPPPRGFIFINLFICPVIYVFINIFNLINNWVENIKQEDFMEIKKGFKIFILAAPRLYQGVKFIIKKN